MQFEDPLMIALQVARHEDLFAIHPQFVPQARQVAGCRAAGAQHHSPPLSTSVDGGSINLTQSDRETNLA